MKSNQTNISSNLIQFSSIVNWNIYIKSMMQKSLKAGLVLFIALFCMKSDVMATHIVGGELKYRSLGDDLYEITLTFRRDCLLGDPEAAFDNPARVYIYNGKGNFQNQLINKGVLKM